MKCCWFAAPCGAAPNFESIQPVFYAAGEAFELAPSVRGVAVR